MRYFITNLAVYRYLRCLKANYAAFTELHAQMLVLPLLQSTAFLIRNSVPFWIFTSAMVLAQLAGRMDAPYRRAA